MLLPSEGLVPLKPLRVTTTTAPLPWAAMKGRSVLTRAVVITGIKLSEEALALPVMTNRVKTELTTFRSEKSACPLWSKARSASSPNM